jgi:hypothetical protein
MEILKQLDRSDDEMFDKEDEVKPTANESKG